jgi:hypothetical protein
MHYKLKLIRLTKRIEVFLWSDIIMFIYQNMSPDGIAYLKNSGR